jgi:hypothetical protein
MLRRSNRSTLASAVPESKPPSQLERSACTRVEFVAAAGLFLVAAVFLFGNLDAKYLWQDEAATAVLGSRLMKYGQPLAYDGVNLITMDYSLPEDENGIDQRTSTAEAGVQYYVRRGDYKSNRVVWIGQPWGSIALAGASVTLFGNNTIAARAPFALAALLTVGLLYWFVRREFHSPLLAWLATALLLTNVSWVLHVRQCRYYSLSSLFLLLTLITYIRWQRGRSWGGAIFVATAWCWFQVDFGSFWPMIGILLVTAFLGAWPNVRRVLVVSVALGAAVAPWIWYYELAGRLKPTAEPWLMRFVENSAHINQFLIPVVLLLAVGVFLALRWRTLDPMVRRILAVSLAMLVAAFVWVPVVTPSSYLRYIIHLSPLAALCTSWVVTECAAWIARRYSQEKLQARIAVALTAFVAVCPFLSNLAEAPFDVIAVLAKPPVHWFIKPEWEVLHEEVFAPNPDPNRLTVEALARVASPGDEILVNYEDIPLMFYTDYRIRGGIPCFRVEDPSRPPRFLIFRPSAASVVYDPAFRREVKRYRWRPIRSGVPDVHWGCIPEPELRPRTASAPEIIMAENLGPRSPDEPEEVVIQCGPFRRRDR